MPRKVLLVSVQPRGPRISLAIGHPFWHTGLRVSLRWMRSVAPPGIAKTLFTTAMP